MCGDNRFTYWEPLAVHSVWLTCSTVNLHIPWYPMRAFSAAHNNFTWKDILKLVIINWFGVEHQLPWSLEKELSNKSSRSSFKWITEVLATWFCVCMESSLSWSKICFRLNWACCAFGLPAGHHQPPASALPLHHLWHRDDCPSGGTDPHLPQDHHGRGRHQRRYKALSWDTQLTSSSMSVWRVIYCTLWLLSNLAIRHITFIKCMCFLTGRWHHLFNAWVESNSTV